VPILILTIRRLQDDSAETKSRFDGDVYCLFQVKVKIKESPIHDNFLVPSWFLGSFNLLLWRFIVFLDSSFPSR